MYELIDFLNKNQGVFSLAFSAVVACATVAYALLTRSLVRETIKLREVETEPELSIYLEPNSRHIYVIEMVIRNIGRGAAYNVRFEYDQNEPMAKRQWSFTRVAFFQKGIEYMAPGQEIRIFLGTSMELFNEPNLRPFEMVVRYQNKAGQQREGRFLIDHRLYENLSRVGRQPDEEIAKALQDIARDISRFAFGFQALKVENVPGVKQLSEEEIQTPIERADTESP